MLDNILYIIIFCQFITFILCTITINKNFSSVRAVILAVKLDCHHRLSCFGHHLHHLLLVSNVRCCNLGTEPIPLLSRKVLLPSPRPELDLVDVVSFERGSAWRLPELEMDLVVVVSFEKGSAWRLLGSICTE